MHPSPASRPLVLALWIIGAVTLVRIVALVFSPLELGGDEAQYWLWSQSPAFGYFSKPPLIAWIIGASTGLFGNTEWAVRLPAPLFHALAALLLMLAGRFIRPAEAGQRAGAMAAVLYILMPGVWFSSGVISTDALLMPAIAGALAALFALLRRPGAGPAMALGLAIGLGFAAKYAMAYFGLGLGLALLALPGLRRAVPVRFWAGAALVAMLLITPNFIWNATHHFATLSHTAANAQGQGLHFAPLSLVKFWGGQWGLFGVLALPLLGRAMGQAMGKGAPAPVRLLAILTALPLALVSMEALVSRANANWAVSAYVPGALLLALWAQKHGRKVLLALAVGLNLMTGVALAAVALSPPLANHLGMSNAFKRVHGWRETTARLAQTIATAPPGRRYAAIIVDNRLFYYGLRYYGRRAHLPKVYLWPRYARPHSQAEVANPLPRQDHGPMLAVSSQRAMAPLMARDFARFTPLGTQVVALGGSSTRRYALYDARGYAPRPRNARFEGAGRYYGRDW